MKKILVLFASLVMLFAVSAPANAGGGFIVKGGVNYSGVDYREVIKEPASFNWKDFVGYHFGLGFQTGSLVGFSLQPELLYQVNSTSIDDTAKLEMNTLQLAVAAQWGIDLVAVKPFVFAAPYFAYNLAQAVNCAEGEESAYQDIIEAAKKAKFDYGIGLGVGLELFNFVQLTAKYNWGFGEFSSWREAAEAYKEAEFNTADGMLCISLALKF